MILDKGQQEDWFASAWIRWFGVATVVSFIALVFHELKTEHPLIDLRVFKSRNFAAGVLLMTTLGAVLYGTTAALPIFLQTSWVTCIGERFCPEPARSRSFCDHGDRRSIGREGSVAHPDYDWIYSASSGFVWLGNINLQMSMRNVIWPSILNGIAIPFIFVPLTTTTMGYLRQEQMGNATGIFNLMRNLGGSFGIALVSTLIVRRAQVHQALMVEHLLPIILRMCSSLRPRRKRFARKVGPCSTRCAAQSAIYGSLLEQASLWAFVENFRLFGIACIVCLPMVLLFKKVQRKPGASVGAHSDP